MILKRISLAIAVMWLCWETEAFCADTRPSASVVVLDEIARQVNPTQALPIDHPAGLDLRAVDAHLKLPLPTTRVGDPEAQTPNASKVDRKTHIGQKISSEIVSLLEEDHQANLKDMIRYRWCYRKCSSITETLGNALLYVGSGISAVAGGVQMIGSSSLSNALLFTSTVCFAAHVTLIGLAKCSKKEEAERQEQLKDLADAVGFTITPLDQNPVDDSANSAK